MIEFILSIHPLVWITAIIVFSLAFSWFTHDKWDM